MRETLELLDDLLGEGLYKIGDKFIDVPKSVVAGDSQSLKAFLSSGGFNIYNDEEDLVSQTTQNQKSQAYSATVSKVRGIKNKTAKSLALSVLLDPDNISDVVSHLSGESPILPSATMATPVKWQKIDWVEQLYRAQDTGREAAVGSGEILACVYFRNDPEIKLAEGDESNTASVDITNGSSSWSVKSGEMSAGSDTYKVNGKLETFKQTLLGKLNSERFGKRIKALMSGQAVISKDAVMQAIYADTKESNSSITHENQADLDLLTSIAQDFYKLADESVQAISDDPYLFVSPTDYRVVGSNDASLRFKATTQDKVGISAATDKSPGRIFTLQEWSSVSPEMKGGTGMRKAETRLKSNVEKLRNTWTLDNIEIIADPAKGFSERKAMLTAIMNSVTDVNAAIEAWSKAALKEEPSVTGGLSGWDRPQTPEVETILKIANLDVSMPDTSGLKPKDAVSKKSERLIEIAEELRKQSTSMIANLASASSNLNRWLRQETFSESTVRGSGHTRPGPRLMETLSLLEDLLTP